jgi:uncharacterized protein with HEPN domain|tara:strand:- start:97 stop:420 length:324 start_codon:yes stop_codon:yes gene_type:complete
MKNAEPADLIEMMARNKPADLKQLLTLHETVIEYIKASDGFHSSDMAFFALSRGLSDDGASTSDITEELVNTLRTLKAATVAHKNVMIKAKEQLRQYVIEHGVKNES